MIDWTKAEELRNEVGSDDFMEIIDVFLEEVEEALASLQSCFEGDLGAILHFIKGSALNLGFSDLAALCADGESHAKAGNLSKINRADISALYQASKEIFLNRYSN